MINPLWLRTLITVSETGSFTKAANVLLITQAAVSQHIQRLEHEFGPLLIRRPRKLELTPAGEKVLAYAQQSDIALQQLRRSLEDESPFSGTISIATPGSCGLAIYPHLLKLQSQHPQLVIHHQFAPTQDIIAAVEENRIELGIVTQPSENDRLTFSPLLQESLCLVAPISFQGNKWSELKQLGFINHPDGLSMANRLFSRCYPGHSISELPIRGFTNQISLILEPVAAGIGFTVLPHFAISVFAQQDKIRILPLNYPITDTLWLVSRAEWPLSARAKNLVELIKKIQP